MNVFGEFFDFFEAHEEGIAGFILTVLALSVVALVFALAVKLVGVA